MNACTWLWSTGSIQLPKNAPWLEEYVHEHLVAPVGKYDDQVDCSAMYLNWAGSKDKQQLFKLAMANQRKKLYGWSGY